MKTVSLSDISGAVKGNTSKINKIWKIYEKKWDEDAQKEKEKDKGDVRMPLAINSIFYKPVDIATDVVKNLVNYEIPYTFEGPDIWYSTSAVPKGNLVMKLTYTGDVVNLNPLWVNTIKSIKKDDLPNYLKKIQKTQDILNTYFGPVIISPKTVYPLPSKGSMLNITTNPPKVSAYDKIIPFEDAVLELLPEIDNYVPTNLDV